MIEYSNSLYVGWVLLVVIVISSLFGCEDDVLLQKVDNDKTKVYFNNEIYPDTLNLFSYHYIYNGGGVAVGDVNNDGKKDIFFAGNMVSSKLYLNEGEWEFKDISETAGIETDRWATGVVMVDINNDGYLDIYVSCAESADPSQRKNLLFVNNRDSTFTEHAEEYNLDNPGYSTQSAFFDYDQDGDLDLYLLNHTHEVEGLNSLDSDKGSDIYPSKDILYENVAGKGFERVSQRARIDHKGHGLGVAIGDLNSDGWPDIYVSNDFIEQDVVYINQGNGRFRDRTDEFLDHQSWSSMGNYVSDFNNDGFQDIFVLDMLYESNFRQKMMPANPDYERRALLSRRGYQPSYRRNTLQLNNGNNSFSEIARVSGIDKTGWCWAPIVVDLNNDGRKDLFVTNGYLKKTLFSNFVRWRKRRSLFASGERLQEEVVRRIEGMEGIQSRNRVFENSGGLTFDDRTKRWGIEGETFSNGASFGDLDNDGDLDLVVSNINGTAGLYRNRAVERGGSSNWFRVDLNGEKSNPDAIGAKVSVYTRKREQHVWNYRSRGYQSSVSDVLHFGLGDVKRIDSVRVTWPDGRTSSQYGVSANQMLAFDYRRSTRPEEAFALEAGSKVFESLRNPITRFTHSENPHNDLEYDPLLPRTYSHEGPAVAVGDISGDGRDDIFVGGSAGHYPTLFMQVEEGYEKRSFGFGKKYEDGGALLFDADEDGDLDLYVASGGSRPRQEGLYQDRLYVNEGGGEFTRAKNALPRITASTSCVTAADYDRDGDLDLFICGRIRPGQYPAPPRSYLLQNTGGAFEDVTREQAPGLVRPGLATSALWTDFDEDGWMDLMIGGEWMPISVFQNRRGTFQEETQERGLGGSKGWWNSLVAGDFDNDGGTEYVAGNLGENTFWEVAPNRPVQGHALKIGRPGGETHFVLSHSVKGKTFPVFPLGVMREGIPELKYKFRTHEKYARTTTEEFLKEEAFRVTREVNLNVSRSSYIEKTEEGTFRMRPLPVRAQFSPVYGMLARDFTGDGDLDLLTVGNDYGANPILGRRDASIGLLMEGDGEGGFTSVPVTESGFVVDGNARSLALVAQDGAPAVLSLVNEGSPKMYRVPGLAEGTRSVGLHPDDAYATVVFPSGEERRREFSYGSGYLSQSSRVFFVPDSTRYTQIVDFSGNRRKVANGEK